MEESRSPIESISAVTLVVAVAIAFALNLVDEHLVGVPQAVLTASALVVAPAAVTEAVMAQPLIALLRRFDAFGRIDVLAHADVAAVFRAVPEVDEVVQTDLSAERLALAGRFALSRRIEAQA